MGSSTVTGKVVCLVSFLKMRCASVRIRILVSLLNSLRSMRLQTLRKIDSVESLDWVQKVILEEYQLSLN